MGIVNDWLNLNAGGYRKKERTMRPSEAITYLKKMDPTEPVFILRAQDKLAVPAIILWIDEAAKAGVKAVKIDGALEVLARFLWWHTRKLPD